MGAKKESVRKVPAVESVEMFARTFGVRFLSQSICYPSRAGVAEDFDSATEGMGDLSLGGPCWRGEVVVLEVGVGSRGTKEECEEVIFKVSDGCTVAFTDGSRDDEGRVAGGWCSSHGGEGCELVESVSTVWDGEVAGMRLTLESLKLAPLLVLSDSRAAIAAVKNAAECGHARTADLREVVNLAGEWASAGMDLRFGWVKAHIGIEGNERANALAKVGCSVGSPLRVTEGGVRALRKKLRAGERLVFGFGKGRVPKCSRRTASRYVQAHTGKGDLGVWRERLGRGVGLCRLCQEWASEIGDHLLFECMGSSGGMGWDWARWLEMDDKSKCAYQFEEGDKVFVGDRTEDVFGWLDREMYGVRSVGSWWLAGVADFLARFFVTRLSFLCHILSFLESRDHMGSPAIPDGEYGVMSL